jgi:hypothetical protein
MFHALQVGLGPAENFWEKSHVVGSDSRSADQETLGDGRTAAAALDQKAGMVVRPARPQYLI